jgi:hypothetical protein
MTTNTDAVPSELREAARQFHNLTQGDNTVIIRAPSAEKRDAIVKAGERLRSALASTTEHADAARGTDAQILFERKLTCEAINGAMAFGYQNTNPPPEDDHWLAQFWKIGRKQAELEAALLASEPAVAADAQDDCHKTCDVCWGENGQKWPCAKRTRSSPAAPAQSAEPVAYVPVDPENGPVWRDVMTSTDQDGGRFPLRALFFDSPQPGLNKINVDAERAAFEEWMRGCEGYPYAGQYANLMWKAWQARAASPQATVYSLFSSSDRRNFGHLAPQEFVNAVIEAVRAQATATQPAQTAPYLPCPTCKGVEGCDHTVPERKRAAERPIYQNRVSGFEAAWRDVRKETFDECSALDTFETRIVYPAPQPVAQTERALTLDEYHEDYGFVVWWTWKDGEWLGEPAWIGTPNDSDWPGYHTHWTKHPAFPDRRAASKRR